MCWPDCIYVYIYLFIWYKKNPGQVIWYIQANTWNRDMSKTNQQKWYWMVLLLLEMCRHSGSLKMTSLKGNCFFSKGNCGSWQFYLCWLWSTDAKLRWVKLLVKTCQSQVVRGEGCHICVPMSKQDSFCSVLIDMYVLDVVPANPGAEVHPTLQQTLQKVRCVHVELTNRKEELFLGWFYKFLVVFWVWEPLYVVFEVQPLGMLSEVLQLQGGCEGEHPHSPICCDLGK